MKKDEPGSYMPIYPPYRPGIKHLAEVAAIDIRALVQAIDRETIIVPFEQAGCVRVISFETRPESEPNLHTTVSVCQTNYSGGVKVVVDLADARAPKS